MTLTPEQIELRRTGITATDIAAIVGANPFRKPINVWEEKRGIAPPYEERPATKWGHKLEPMILADYAERHEVRVEACGTRRHRKRKWQLATPDGLRFPYGSDDTDGGLEVKCHGDDALRFGPGLEYGPEGTDEVPQHELVQCMWGIDVIDVPRWDLLMFDQRPHDYIIDRDDELIGMLVEQGERFLRDHVQTGNPPPPDGSSAWDEYLKRKFATNVDSYIDADRHAELIALVHQLREARAATGDAERREAQLEQRIKNAIGEKAGLSFHEPDRAKAVRIHWKWAKAGQTKDWKATFAKAQQAAAMLVSARAPVLELGVRVLRGLPLEGALDGRVMKAGDASIDAVALADTIEMLVQLSHSLATQGPELVAKKQARPFNVPRHWPKSGGEKTTNDTEEET